VNALLAIVVTEFGMVIEVNAVQFENALSPIVVSCEKELNVTEFNFKQEENASVAIDVTDSGMAIDVNSTQSLNAAMPIV
jgi:hypothetical protein